MSASFIPNGLMLPEEILCEIWLMVVLESLESLYGCRRQVCPTCTKVSKEDGKDLGLGRGLDKDNFKRNHTSM